MRIIRTLTLIVIPLIFSCAGGNSSLWIPYTFDGTNFSPPIETVSPAIWIRSGHFPMISKPDPGSALANKLPPGTGAVAGICYLQSTSGKMSMKNSFAPYPNEQITFINNEDGVFVTRTDQNGYFAEYLRAGNYYLFCRGVRSELKVNQGETTLVPIRGGKRMAD